MKSFTIALVLAFAFTAYATESDTIGKIWLLFHTHEDPSPFALRQTNPICSFFPLAFPFLAEELIDAIEKAGEQFGTIAVPYTDMLKQDVNVVHDADAQQDATKAKEGLEKSADDTKLIASKLREQGSDGEKLAAVADEAASMLEKLAGEFTDTTGPFNELPPKAQDLTQKIEANTQ